MRPKALLVALPVALATLFPTAGSAGTTSWEPFSTSALVNFAEPALERTPDGVLHVLWVQDDPSTSSEDLFQTTIAPDGTVGAATGVLTDWSSMWAGGGDLVPTSDGKLRYFFGGLRGTGNNNNLSMLTSDTAGTTWSLHSQNVVDGGDGAAYATTVGAGVSLDYTPFQTFGGTLHRGTSASTDSVRVHDELGSNCCAYESDVAADLVTGRMFFGWFSNADDKRGVWAHEIDPANGQVIGDPMLMPGVVQATTEGGEPQAGGADTRVPMTGRPGNEGVYFAYTGGYPFQQKVLVWRVGDATSTTVARTTKLESHNDPAIAADSSGRLWVAWSKGSRLFFRRSNADLTHWGQPVSIRPAPDNVSIWDIKMEAQTTVLDVVALFDTDAGSPTLWHRQVLPGLTLTAEPSGFRREARVTFTVTDAGDPIEGARVEAGGENGLTDASGQVRLRLGPYSRGRRIVATAHKDGYTPGRRALRVRR